MADFSDVVTELQTINSTLETLVATADPQGAAAAESEREKEAAAAQAAPTTKATPDKPKEGSTNAKK